MEDGPGGRQGIWVAVIGAIATIGAAGILLLKPSDASKTADAVSSPTIQVISTSFHQTSDKRYVDVKGRVHSLTVATDQALYAYAAPANGEPVGRRDAAMGPQAAVPDQEAEEDAAQHWYVSPPISLYPDGAWETRIDIDPTEGRELIVQTALLPVCVSGSRNPACATSQASRRPPAPELARSSIERYGPAAPLVTSRGTTLSIPPP